MSYLPKLSLKHASLVIVTSSLIFMWQGALMCQSKVNFIDGNVAIGIPVGAFGRHITDPKGGIDIGYLRQTKIESPLFWGISVYYHPLASSGTYVLAEQLDFNYVNFDYNTTSHLLGSNAKMRFYPTLPLNKLELYVEALIGYKWLFTNTIKKLSNDAESSDTHFNKGSLSLTYGAAIGVNYPLNSSMYLNIRGNYLPGLSKQYYAINHDNLVKNSTLDLFDLKKSTTDLVRWDIGITWRFTGGDF